MKYIIIILLLLLTGCERCSMQPYGNCYYEIYQGGEKVDIKIVRNAGMSCQSNSGWGGVYYKAVKWEIDKNE